MESQRPGDILIVEDDSAFLSLACVTLARYRHGVVSCSTGEEALAHLERIPFDIALIGAVLPDMEGDALARHIKTDSTLQRTSVGLLVSPTPEGYALLDTLTSTPVGQTHSREVGAPDDFIFKNATEQELIARVRSLLRVRRYLEEIHNAVSALMTFAEGAEEQDRRAKGHCKRLAIMAIELGAVLGLDDWSLTLLERAGYLHDVGKACIPGAIMTKAQPLSPREMQIIQSHCVIGEKMCRNVGALEPILPIIRHHHERVDGSGYPDGLRGDQIPVLAQIFSIVDIYESLRLWRPYRPPLSDWHACQVMSEEVVKGFWNRRIFETFRDHVLPGLESRLAAQQVLWPREDE